LETPFVKFIVFSLRRRVVELQKWKIIADDVYMEIVWFCYDVRRQTVVCIHRMLVIWVELLSDFIILALNTFLSNPMEALNTFSHP